MLTLGRLLTIAVLSLAVSGCGFLSWTRVTINEPLSDTDAAFIVPGQTPVAEVVAHLGAPEDMVLSEGGAVAPVLLPRHQIFQGQLWVALAVHLGCCLTDLP